MCCLRALFGWWRWWCFASARDVNLLSSCPLFKKKTRLISRGQFKLGVLLLSESSVSSSSPGHVKSRTFSGTRLSTFSEACIALRGMEVGVAVLDHHVLGHTVAGLPFLRPQELRSSNILQTAVGQCFPQISRN